MADFDKFEDIGRVIKQACSTAVQNTGQFIGDELYKNIKSMVYNGVFQPNIYERREEHGGFCDRNNIIVTPVAKDIVKVENITLANKDELGNRLDEIIEYGQDYHWRRQPEARPVFDITEKELMLNGKLEEVLKKEFSKLGLECEK